MLRKGLSSDNQRSAERVVVSISEDCYKTAREELTGRYLDRKIRGEKFSFLT